MTAEFVDFESSVIGALPPRPKGDIIGPRRKDADVEWKHWFDLVTANLPGQGFQLNITLAEILAIALSNETGDKNISGISDLPVIRWVQMLLERQLNSERENVVNIAKLNWTVSSTLKRGLLTQIGEGVTRAGVDLIGLWDLRMSEVSYIGLDDFNEFVLLDTRTYWGDVKKRIHIYTSWAVALGYVLFVRHLATPYLVTLRRASALVFVQELLDILEEKEQGDFKLVMQALYKK